MSNRPKARNRLHLAETRGKKRRKSLTNVDRVNNTKKKSLSLAGSVIIDRAGILSGRDYRTKRCSAILLAAGHNSLIKIAKKCLILQ